MHLLLTAVDGKYEQRQFVNNDKYVNNETDRVWQAS